MTFKQKVKEAHTIYINNENKLSLHPIINISLSFHKFKIHNTTSKLVALYRYETVSLLFIDVVHSITGSLPSF